MPLLRDISRVRQILIHPVPEYSSGGRLIRPFGGNDMAKYKCMMCGYVYDEAKGDPDNGIPAGTKWEDLPASYACPVCASPKGQFKKVEED